MARNTEASKNIDAQIGDAIKRMRIERGLSRQQLAAKIGVTHQQLMKYEKGTNRISAGRLQNIADAFAVTPQFFFDKVTDNFISQSTEHNRLCIEVSRNFMRIKSSGRRVAISNMIRAFANEDEAA
jgi:transcriptional regulator with XRE-family HTH domain